jgi:hypothetical protein
MDCPRLWKNLVQDVQSLQVPLAEILHPKQVARDLYSHGHELENPEAHLLALASCQQKFRLPWQPLLQTNQDKDQRCSHKRSVAHTA